MEIVFLIIFLIAIGFILFIKRSRKKKNKYSQETRQINLNELQSVINDLLENKLEYDFFGISSDGIDCIYFSNNKGKINIEFEVMTNEQKPYVEKFESFAKKNNYQITKTTYGVKPNYPELNEAPLYRIEMNADRWKATELGIEIMKTIFEKNETTNFTILP